MRQGGAGQCTGKCRWRCHTTAVCRSTLQARGCGAPDTHFHAHQGRLRQDVVGGRDELDASTAPQPLSHHRRQLHAYRVTTARTAIAGCRSARHQRLQAGRLACWQCHESSLPTWQATPWQAVQSHTSRKPRCSRPCPHLHSRRPPPRPLGTPAAAPAATAARSPGPGGVAAVHAAGWHVWRNAHGRALSKPHICI